MSNSIVAGKWMINSSADGIWTSDYYETREDAIEAGKEECDFDSGEEFYVGQISKDDVVIHFNVDSILENVAENAYEQVGEVADGYLNHVKKEDYQVLEERMHKVLHEWMEERDYKPHFFKITNTERIGK